MNINKTTLGIISLVMMVSSFFGGVKYGENKSATLTNINPSLLTQGGQFRTGGANGQRGTRMMNGGVAGSIVAKDATSITVALRDNGSKIVFISSSTTINKMTSGSLDDLSIGKEVSVSGTPNSDGSIIAQSIQLRPSFATSTSR